MNTRIEKIGYDGNAFTEKDEQILSQAGNVIKEGGLVAFPTETVYGLGGDALNRDSARRIYAAKDRPSDNPLIVHICRFEDMKEIVEKVPETAVLIAQTFWPGPLTMILPKSSKVPYETTGGLDTVAVRFPSHPVARKLISCSGGYVAAPSANRSGRPSPTEPRYVIEDLDGRVDMILDGGKVEIGLESTIVDLTVTPPQILRPGYVTREMLTEVLGEIDIDVTIMDNNSGQPPKAPGMKYRHYAPKGELIIVEGSPDNVTMFMNRQALEGKAQGEKVGIIGTGEFLSKYRADVVRCLGERRDEESVARSLYSVLRQMDDEQVTRIYSEGFAEDGYGQAIMNRLLKAAGYRVVKV